MGGGGFLDQHYKSLNAVISVGPQYNTEELGRVSKLEGNYRDREEAEN